MYAPTPVRPNQARPSLAPLLIKAAAAGVLASIPMAFAMRGIQRLLPRREQYALPPEEITVEVANRASAGPLVESEDRRRATTWLAHLGYGGAAASLYPLLARRLKLPPVARGMVFALGVWAASYMGWLPAVRILPPAPEIPAGRNAMMIASHLLWGAIIGGIVGNMEENNG